MGKYLNLRFNIALGLLFTFLANTVDPCPVYAQEDFILPAPGQMVALSPAYSPVVLKGIKLDPKNPFSFHFYVDTGNEYRHPDSINDRHPERSEGSQEEQLKQESSKLIKYFLASLTIPEKDLWVNLSPYEKDRIVPKEFGQTEMGRDLLAEDYLLKQITASLIYPESHLGKEFWNKVYTQAQAKYGTTNIPINTFNKVWIVPDKAVVYENGGVAFVLENHLKVMLEQDYLSLSHHVIPAKAGIQNTSTFGSKVIREILIPALTKEVNEGKNFAPLRQVFYSLILATWYKKKIKDSILNKIYSDRNKIQGLVIPAPSNVIPAKAGIQNRENVEFIYQQYLKAFKEGVYNYIKQESDPITNEVIPKKYFSGGVEAKYLDKVNFAIVGSQQISRAQITKVLKTKFMDILTLIGFGSKTDNTPQGDGDHPLVNKIVFDGGLNEIVFDGGLNEIVEKNQFDYRLPTIKISKIYWLHFFDSPLQEFQGFYLSIKKDKSLRKLINDLAWNAAARQPNDNDQITIESNVLSISGAFVLEVNIKQKFISDKSWKRIEANSKLSLKQLRRWIIRRFTFKAENFGWGLKRFADLVGLEIPCRLEYDRHKEGGMTTTLFVKIDEVPPNEAMISPDKFIIGRKEDLNIIDYREFFRQQLKGQGVADDEIESRIKALELAILKDVEEQGRAYYLYNDENGNSLWSNKFNGSRGVFQKTNETLAEALANNGFYNHPKFIGPIIKKYLGYWETDIVTGNRILKDVDPLVPSGLSPEMEIKFMRNVITSVLTRFREGEIDWPELGLNKYKQFLLKHNSLIMPSFMAGALSSAITGVVSTYLINYLRIHQGIVLPDNPISLTDVFISLPGDYFVFNRIESAVRNQFQIEFEEYNERALTNKIMGITPAVEKHNLETFERSFSLLNQYFAQSTLVQIKALNELQTIVRLNLQKLNRFYRVGLNGFHIEEVNSQWDKHLERLGQVDPANRHPLIGINVVFMVMLKELSDQNPEALRLLKEEWIRQKELKHIQWLSTSLRHAEAEIPEDIFLRALKQVELMNLEQKQIFDEHKKAMILEKMQSEGRKSISAIDINLIEDALNEKMANGDYDNEYLDRLIGQIKVMGLNPQDKKDILISRFFIGIYSRLIQMGASIEKQNDVPEGYASRVLQNANHIRGILESLKSESFDYGLTKMEIDFMIFKLDEAVKGLGDSSKLTPTANAAMKSLPNDIVFDGGFDMKSFMDQPSETREISRQYIDEREFLKHLFSPEHEPYEGVLIDTDNDLRWGSLIQELIINAYWRENLNQKIETEIKVHRNAAGHFLEVNISQPNLLDSSWRSIWRNSKMNIKDLKRMLSRKWTWRAKNKGKGFKSFADLVDLKIPVRIEYKRDENKRMTTKLLVKIDRLPPHMSDFGTEDPRDSFDGKSIDDIVEQNPENLFAQLPSIYDELLNNSHWREFLLKDEWSAKLYPDLTGLLKTTYDRLSALASNEIIEKHWGNLIAIHHTPSSNVTSIAKYGIRPTTIGYTGFVIYDFKNDYSIRFGMGLVACGIIEGNDMYGSVHLNDMTGVVADITHPNIEYSMGKILADMSDKHGGMGFVNIPGWGNNGVIPIKAQIDLSVDKKQLNEMLSEYLQHKDSGITDHIVRNKLKEIGIVYIWMNRFIKAMEREIQVQGSKAMRVPEASKQPVEGLGGKQDGAMNIKEKLDELLQLPLNQHEAIYEQLQGEAGQDFKERRREIIRLMMSYSDLEQVFLRQRLTGYFRERFPVSTFAKLVSLMPLIIKILKSGKATGEDFRLQLQLRGLSDAVINAAVENSDAGKILMQRLSQVTVKRFREAYNEKTIPLDWRIEVNRILKKFDQTGSLDGTELDNLDSLLSRPVLMDHNENLKNRNVQRIEELIKFFGKNNFTLDQIKEKVRGVNEVDIIEILTQMTSAGLLQSFRKRGAKPSRWQKRKPKKLDDKQDKPNDAMKAAIQITAKGPGGIDLNPAQMSMQVKQGAEDFKVNFNGTEIDAAQITGVTFSIRTMTPVANLPEILGLNIQPADKPKRELLAKV